MKRRGFLLALAMLVPGIALAQKKSDAARFGVWMGPVATPETPVPEGFEPFYPRLIWDRSLGERDVRAVRMVGEHFVTVEAERDKGTKRAKAGTWRVYFRKGDATKFTEAQEITPLSALIKDKPEGDVSLYCLPRSHTFCLRGDFGANSFSAFGTLTDDGIYSSRVAEFGYPPIGVFYISAKETGFLTSPSGTNILFSTLDKETYTDSLPRTVRVSLRNTPVSAATSGEFAGGKTSFVAVTGSGANGVVSFGAVRGKKELPDTEEEFSPGMLATWSVSTHPFPYLATVKNTGSEEGTDNPNGRLYLSLYHPGEVRWITVWESPPFGQAIINIAPTSDEKSLLVLYRQVDGTARIARLTP